MKLNLLVAMQGQGQQRSVCGCKGEVYWVCRPNLVVLKGQMAFAVLLQVPQGPLGKISTLKLLEYHLSTHDTGMTESRSVSGKGDGSPVLLNGHFAFVGPPPKWYLAQT